MSFFTECLAQHRVEDLTLPTGEEFVTLSLPEQTLFSAVQVLSKYQLFSAPVVDKDGRLAGLIDCTRIVARVVEQAMAGEAELVDEPLSAVCLGLDDTAQIRLQDHLDGVFRIVAGPHRRAVVVRDDGTPYSIVRQSVLLKFLVDKRNEIFLHGLKHAKVAKELCSSGAVAVPGSRPALEAFELMRARGFTSLPVLGEDGNVASLVSAASLVVGLAHMPDKSQALQVLRSSSVLDFVLKTHRLDPSHATDDVIVDQDMPLQNVLGRLRVHHVNRVVVCNGRKPLGVLSLTDVCRVEGLA